ncbi:MAG: hypothetical protein ONB27_11570 [candidate division KSB1 bacterium]|nr:hypothetical protein [candidate division KSB1 bacterium]
MSIKISTMTYCDWCHGIGDVGITFKTPIIAIDSGWDKPVLSAVEGFSKPGFGLAARLRRMLLKNLKLQKANHKQIPIGKNSNLKKNNFISESFRQRSQKPL